MRIPALLATTVILATLACGSAEPPPSSTDLTLTDLDLALRLEYDDGSLTGHATMSVSNLGTTPAARIPVQLGRLFAVADVAEPNGTPVPFTQDVISLADWPTFQVNQIWLTADPPLAPGDTGRYSIAYRGYLVGYTETGMQYVHDHLDREFTILREDALAFPSLRLPSRHESRSMPRGDFTFRLSVTAPADLVVATGVPESERTETDGTATWTFEGTRPVPFLNVTVAPYQRVASGNVRIFHFPDDSSGARAVLHAIERALDRYTTWFGPIERDAALTVMEIPEGWGSQASLIGGIIQTADAFRHPTSFTALYHELAHLWHPMDTGKPPVRWNEGLATFLQYRAAAALDHGRPLAEAMTATADRAVRRLENDSTGATVPMIEYGDRGLTDLSYSTGALMCYALYRTLGEAEFDRMMGEYFTTYRTSGSTTEEFAQLVRRHEGLALEPLLDDWLYTTKWLGRLAGGESLEEIVRGYQGS